MGEIGGSGGCNLAATVGKEKLERFSSSKSYDESDD
ncbi:uncharacterized protein G2W53_007977 [Senna tora]|uniref:Uncharacterized protein n=1 Tax=Senna tora TaxID=362788 RepID=A0A834X7N8_9FABA|nr:uncharacterized protein G2W53_007977 [Senna tora]